MKLQCGGINQSMQIERVREGVAVLLNDLWYSVVIDSGYVSSKILYIKFKFSRVKVCVVWGTAPMKDMVKKGRGSGMTWTELQIE